MENSVLTENLKHISRYNRDLAQRISVITDIKGNYEIKESKSGDSVLFRDNTPVDDDLDPVWNALEKYNNLASKDKKSITIIYGLGLGYLLKEFAGRYDGKIILYEPNLENLRITFELVDFSEELARNNIRVTNNYEEIKKAYLDLFFKDYKLNIVSANYYENATLAEIREFRDQMERIHGVYQSNYSNLMEKGANWTRCLFTNIPNILQNQDFHILKNKYRGKTAVIISAGPSLDKNIRDLLPYKDKVVIFCVNTALKAALKNGVIPDFVVAIEASFNTKKHLELPEIGKLRVISGTNVFNGVFDLKPQCFLNYHINKEDSARWLGKILQVPIDDYEVAGTVSIIALYAAKMTGIDKIILIGQDLAYTDNKCYARDSAYGGYEINNDQKVTSSDTSRLKKELAFDDNLISYHIEQLNKDLYYVKGYNGDKVLSRSDLILFIIYFEELAQTLAPEITLVNATEGGAYIKGFEHIPLKKALENYTDSDIDKNIPSGRLKPDTRELKKRKNIVLSELKVIIKNCHEIKDLLASINAQESLEVLKRNYYTIKNLASKNILMKNFYMSNFLIIDNMLKDNNNTEDDLAELSAQFGSFFSAINRACPGHISFIREIINRIEVL